MSAPADDLDTLRAMIGRFRGRRVAVLGDVMVDRYLWGHVDRISPEAPVPVVEIERESMSLGGAGNVAANGRELESAEALVVSDYGKGVVHPGTLAVALGMALGRGIPVCVDPKESHIDAYRDATILTPNQHEAGWVQGRRIVDEPSLME